MVCRVLLGPARLGFALPAYESAMKLSSSASSVSSMSSVRSNSSMEVLQASTGLAGGRVEVVDGPATEETAFEPTGARYCGFEGADCTVDGFEKELDELVVGAEGLGRLAAASMASKSLRKAESNSSSNWSKSSAMLKHEDEPEYDDAQRR